VVVATEEPVAVAAEEPSAAPVEEPSVAPVEEPSAAPVEEPLAAPSAEPPAAPAEEPVAENLVKETHFPVDSESLIEELDIVIPPSVEEVPACAAADEHSPVSSGDETPPKGRLSPSGSDISETTPLMTPESYDIPPVVVVEPAVKGRSTPEGKEAYIDPELGRLTPTAPPNYPVKVDCCKNKLFMCCAVLNVIAPIPLYCWYRSLNEKRAGNYKKSKGYEDKAMSSARIGFTVTVIAAVVLLWLYITKTI